MSIFSLHKYVRDCTLLLILCFSDVHFFCSIRHFCIQCARGFYKNKILFIYSRSLYDVSYMSSSSCLKSRPWNMKNTKKFPSIKFVCVCILLLWFFMEKENKSTTNTHTIPIQQKSEWKTRKKVTKRHGKCFLSVIFNII